MATNGALFIQWTRTGNAVTGTLSEAYTNLSDPTQAQSESHPFTGVISGSSVTLTLDSGDNWNGTLNGSGITLSYTNSDGSLQTFDFRPASVADYNAAVAAVQGTAAGAQKRQAQREAVAQLKQRIEDEGSTVANDMQQLMQDVASARNDLSGMADDVATTATDTNGTYKAMQSVLAEAAKYPGGNYGGVCADADGVTADADGVSADNDGVSADMQSLDYDLNSIAGDISKLSEDSRAFQADHQALPSYQPANPVDQGAVSQAITSAQTAMASVRRTRVGYVAKAKSLLKTANGYAAQAQAACKKVGG